MEEVQTEVEMQLCKCCVTGDNVTMAEAKKQENARNVMNWPNTAESFYNLYQLHIKGQNMLYIN